MRTIKPLRLGVLHRVLELGRRPHLIVTAFATTPLSGKKEALTEMALWKLVEERLGTNAILDEGHAKPAGEVIVHGDFYAPGAEPVAISFAGLEVARAGKKLVQKKLAVLGDRFWRSGLPTAPQTFSTLPLDATRAFGGEGFEMNPIGLGMKPKSESAPWRLPNIEDPERLIRAPSDRPHPVGFGPLDLSLPQRRALAGSYGGDYLETRFPGPAADMDPRFFHTAPEDQRIDGYFSGDETFLLQNLHPNVPRLEGKLTSIRCRAFLKKRFGTDETTTALLEVPLRMDTVIVFADRETIVTAFRGMVPIEEDDASDIECLVLGAEDAEMPRPESHYQRVMELRSNRDDFGALFALRDEDLMPQAAAGWGPAGLPDGDMVSMSRTEGLLDKRAKAKLARNHEEQRRALVTMGLDPDVYLPREAPEDALPALDDVEGIVLYTQKTIARAKEDGAKAEARREELIERAKKDLAGSGVDWDQEAAKAGAAFLGPPKYRAKAELERLHASAELARNASMPLVELEARLCSPGFLAALEAQEELQFQGYRTSVAFRPAAPKLSPEAQVEARARLVHARDTGEPLTDPDLTGADLSGLDLSGMSLAGVFLECADLSGTILEKANLENAVLARAQLRGTRFGGANLDGANLGDTTFDDVDMTGASLRRAMIMRARLDLVSFVRANLEEAILLESTFGKVDFSGASIERIAFCKADLRGVRFVGANLTKSQIVECDVSGCDFSGATLDGAAWISTNARGARLGTASMKKMAWPKDVDCAEGDLRGVTLERGCLRGTSLRGADLTGAILTGSDLGEVDLTGAVLRDVSARGTLLMRANLSGAILTGANLMEAVLNNAIIVGADFTKANLFRASLSRARGDDKTRFTGANVEFVLKEPRRA